MSSRKKKEKRQKQSDPFDIYMTLGLIVKGYSRDLRLVLDFIKNTPEVNLVYQKATVGTLEIKEKEAKNE